MTPTMTPKTLTALKASIAHWKKMRRDPTSSFPSSQTCQLCQSFLGADCNGCPVHTKTGNNFCLSTPFHEAYAAYEALTSFATTKANLKRWRTAADAEIEFLESLLPK